MPALSTYWQEFFLRRRSRSAVFTSLISISLVLFFLGLFAGIAIFSGTFAQEMESSIHLRVFMRDGISEQEQLRFRQELLTKEHISDFQYISKEEARQTLLARTGEDVNEILGGINPLWASFDISLKREYLDTENLGGIRDEFESMPLVAEVHFPFEMLFRMRRNFRLINSVFTIIGICLLGIGIYLIFGTIRLTIFARRLSIRTMQLIGATRAFIRRPFLWQGLRQGLLAGIAGGGMLWIFSMGLQTWFRNIRLESELLSPSLQIGIFMGIVLLGALLGFLGSYFAVNRYLSRNLDELM